MPTAVIAEDEPLLRADLIASLRTAWPELAIVAEAEDGAAAFDEITSHQPDLAFLDIRMPGLTGIDVAAAIANTSPKTQVVFVTAYNQYAIDAFEKGAVDYLLKPVSAERLAATVQRLKSRLTAPVTGNAAMLEELARRLEQVLPANRPREPLAWVTASAGRDTRLIMIEDVIYFQADSKYTVVMTAEGEALIRKPIRELLAELDTSIFKQIHRSTIVNVKAIQSIGRDDVGKGTIRLKKRPETLTVSQPFMHLFRHL
jgi:DNA-binding LytR/AlgR family response regulator